MNLSSSLFNFLTPLSTNRRVELATAVGLSLAMIALIATVQNLINREHERQLALNVTEPIVVFPDFAIVSDVEVKKQQFFDFLQDYVHAENEEVAAVRAEILELQELTGEDWSLSGSERALMLELAEKYEVPETLESDREIVEELLLRVDEIPVSLVLAQAANESAWGTSRFALEGLNIFGQWCYVEGCGIVPRRRPSGATHEVKAFDNVSAAVQGYFMNINTHRGYRNFRQMRAQMRRQQRPLNSLELAYGLGRYSERGDHYIDEIQNIILQNDLTERDRS